MECVSKYTLLDDTYIGKGLSSLFLCIRFVKTVTCGKSLTHVSIRMGLMHMAQTNSHINQ